ncbi:MAG: TRAP transporter small permease [Thermoanaerobacteraceae bacterium]|nr:TRAP transporter small permease [Thermoanaerobacteraceae bacterium]
MARFEEYFYKFLEYVSAILLVIMVIIVFANVIFRYFLDFSIASTEELSRFMFIWISFIGSALALRYSEHLSIDFITNILPDFMKKVVMIFDQFVVLIIVSLMGVGGWRMTISDMAVRSSATDIPLGYIDAIVPIVAIIMVFIQIEKIIGFFIGNKQSKKEV